MSAKDQPSVAVASASRVVTSTLGDGVEFVEQEHAVQITGIVENESEVRARLAEQAVPDSGPGPELTVQRPGLR